MSTDTVSQQANLDAALEYAGAGWPVLPLRGKKPLTQHGYKDATRDEAQIREWWTRWPDANIGVATGKVSGWLVVDVDTKNDKKGDVSLRALEEEFGPLPKTRHSVTASGGSHYVFRMPDHPIKSWIGMREGLDLLATGSYVVAPPSTIDGKAYCWTEMCEAAPCPVWLAELAKRSSRPQEAVSENRIPELIRELFPEGKESNGYSMVRCPYHDDMEPSLSITLQDGQFRCFACLATGSFVQLYAKVKGVSEEEARDIVTRPAHISQLNQRHAVLSSLTGKARILNEEYDAMGMYLGVSFSSTRDLDLRYKNQRIRYARRTRSIAEDWLEHPKRRQYERMIFEPGAPQELGSFNLWKGFAVEPKQGDCEPYRELLYETICRQDQRSFDYVEAWKADAVQNPRSKPGVGIVLRGRQGTGKSFACKEFGKLFGPHFLTLSQQRHLLGNFNMHLMDKLVLLAEEAFWAGEKDAEGVLKDLITGDRMIIEPKGRESFSVNNYIRLLICSNHDWVIPAGRDERRFLVLDVGDRHHQDHPYFAKLKKWMNEEGGREAWLYSLQHYDLSKVNLRDVPHTQALQENKMHSMGPAEKFVYEVLVRGRWSRSHEGWKQVVACHEVHTAYIEHAMRVGQSRKSTETELGRAIHKLLPGVRNRQMQDEGQRLNAYEFPELETCRKSFGIGMNWEDHPWLPPETTPVIELSSDEMRMLLPEGVHG
jgi:hypothetical protein